MTRKSLAFGAGLALVGSGLVASPAQAAGLDQGYVSLAPNTGTAYAVLTDGTFDLKSNYASSLMAAGRQLKFLVTDPDAQIRVDVDVNGSTADAVYTQAVAIASAAATVNGGADGVKERITVTTSTAHHFSVGDTVTIAGTSLLGTKSGTTNIDLKGAVVVTAAATSTTFAFDVADATVDAATVTPTSATVSFTSTTASAATVATNVVSITVANGSHFVAGDVVTVGGTTFSDSGSADKKGDITLSAVNGNTLTGALTAADGAMTLSATTVTLKTPITTTTLLGRAVLVGKELGNWRILGATDADVAVSARDADDNSFVVETIDNSISDNMVLRLVNTDGTETYSATVTAWVDDNDNNVIDATEQVSPTRTVTFYDESDLTVTSVFTPPVIGGSTDALQAFVSISPELNGQQVGTGATEVSGTFTVQSGSVTNLTTNTYDATAKSWRIDGDNSIGAGTYTFRAKVNGVAIGNTVTQAVAAAVADDTEIVVAATNDTTYVKNVAANGTLISGETSTVRKGKTATATITVVDVDDLSVGAGRPVTLTFQNATTTTDWTINGVKVLDNAASGTKVYTTNADGKVVLEISSTSGANGDTIEFIATPENLTSDKRSELKLTWATASYSIVDLNAPGNGTARTITEGGSISFNLYAKDQWNSALAGDYRLQMTSSGRTVDGTNVAFSNGAGTYTITDEDLGVGSTITVATQLQELSSGVWVNSTDAADLADITVTVATAPVTSIVLSTITDGGGGDNDGVAPDLTVKQIAEYNAETSQGDFVNPATGLEDAYFTISSGVAAGETVTVSGAGLYFGYYDASASAVKRVAKDSLTFVMDGTSDRIYVYSNVYAKAKVVTVESRGRSATIKVTTDVADAKSGTAWVIDMPATAQPGSTFKVTATLTDAFGNPVKVSTANDVAVKYTGPGIVFGTLPNTTDADGQLSFAVLLGSNDSGTATVTLSYDQNSDDDFTGVAVGDLDVVTSKSLTVGASAATAADKKLNAGSFNGFVAVYAKGYKGATLSWKIAGVWFRTTIDADYVVFQRKTAAVGVDVNVELYINGVRPAAFTKSVTTK